MRTIKFRAWYKNQMCYFNPLENWSVDTETRKLWLNTSNALIYPEELEKCEIMEFTGLLDKKGKEIYEGDIIESPYYIMGKETGHKNIKEVVFHNGQFGVFGDNKYSFIELFGLFREVESSKEYIPNFGEVFREYEPVFKVIGNIFENRKLLDL